MKSLFGNEIIDLDMQCEKERVRKVYDTGQSLIRIWNFLDVVWCLWSFETFQFWYGACGQSN
jgi:hypothetical protein